MNGVTTKYTLFGDKVAFETTGSDKIHYSYDASGNLFSMNLNGTEYYYTRNAQGDITGLIDGAKNQVVSYTYDTWGKLISTTGSLAGTLGLKNPYRYRGYRYDTETGLYYLQSRYYNPDWGRFVNADAVDVLTATQGELKSHNLFAYGMNDPVNNIDEDGYLSKKSKWIIGGVVLTAVVIVIVIGATGGAASPLLLALKGGAAMLKAKASILAAKASAIIGAKVYSALALEATKNAKSGIVVLGKYMQNGISYVDMAIRQKATYFQLDSWNQISRLIGNDNMWKINKAFLNQQWAAGKQFYFSHNPLEATGYFQQEVLHLISLGAKGFVKVGDMWKMIR